MTREVTRTITDAEMSYCWKWYPETLFRGSKAMNAEGMIDAVTMISPAWYDILYDHVAGTPGTDNPFCDYDNDLQFNQNLLNYEQQCAITARLLTTELTYYSKFFNTPHLRPTHS